MNKYFTISVVTLFFILISEFGIYYGGMAGMLSVLFVYLLIDRYEYLVTLQEYGNMYENIYVVSNHPKKDIEINLPEDLKSVVVYSKYTNVFKSKETEAKWLRRSRNPFFCDDTLKVNQKIQIIPIIFQDGKFVNESWEDFQDRVISEIKFDRSERHNLLKSTDSIWYNQYSNNQSGVTWKK